MPDNISISSHPTVDDAADDGVCLSMKLSFVNIICFLQFKNNEAHSLQLYSGSEHEKLANRSSRKMRIPRASHLYLFKEKLILGGDANILPNIRPIKIEKKDEVQWGWSSYSFTFMYMPASVLIEYINIKVFIINVKI